MKLPKIFVWAVVLSLISFSNVSFAADTLAPETTDNIKATVNGDIVTVTWDQAADNVGVTGYIVYWGTKTVSEEMYTNSVNVGNVLTYNIEGLEEGTLYYLSVAAYDAAGNVAPKPGEGYREITVIPGDENYVHEDPDYGGCIDCAGDYKQITVLDYESGANSVLLGVENQNLTGGYKYYIGCHVVEEGKYSSWFNRSALIEQPIGAEDTVELYVDGLKPETEYRCYGAIVTTSSDVELHSENIYVATHGEGQHAEDVFSDVYETTKNKESVSYLYNTKIINGYSDGTFKPNNLINRAELLKILVESKGITPLVTNNHDCFTDVAKEWFAPYVCYAVTRNWVNGYEDGSFRPASPVNKVEALKMILTINDIDLNTEIEKPFNDLEENSWYYDYVLKAYEMGLLEETGGNFNPANARTRLEIVENIYRLLTAE